MTRTRMGLVLGLLLALPLAVAACDGGKGGWRPTARRTHRGEGAGGGDEDTA